MAIATYCRVSTEDQTIKRQLESTSEYATEQLDTPLDEIRGYRDKSTGTDTERSGYRHLMADIQTNEITAVIVHEISRLARSLRDLDRTVSQIVENGAEVHFVRDGLIFGSGDDSLMDRLMLQMLGAFAEWEARGPVIALDTERLPLDEQLVKRTIAVHQVLGIEVALQ